MFRPSQSWPVFLFLSAHGTKSEVSSVLNGYANLIIAGKVDSKLDITNASGADHIRWEGFDFAL